MTPEVEQLVAKLRELASTKTQTEAALLVNRTKSRVNQLAQEYNIDFVPRSPRQRIKRRCSRCNAESPRHPCLRCKWTPARIRRLRHHLKLSQVAMALKLRMNIWAVQRWENEHHVPSLPALRALERLARQ